VKNKVPQLLIERVWKLVHIFRRLLTIQNNVILLYRHDSEISQSINKVSYEIKKVDLSNVEDAFWSGLASSAEIFHQLLEQEHLGYYVYLGGKVVHRSWVRRGPATVNTWKWYAPLCINSRQAYIHFSKTSADERGRGIFSSVLSLIAYELEKKGYEDIFVATTVNNIPACKGIERAGFKEIDRVSVKVWFGIPFLYPESSWCSNQNTIKTNEYKGQV